MQKTVDRSSANDCPNNGTGIQRLEFRQERQFEDYIMYPLLQLIESNTGCYNKIQYEPPLSQKHRTLESWFESIHSRQMVGLHGSLHLKGNL